MGIVGEGISRVSSIEEAITEIDDWDAAQEGPASGDVGRYTATGAFYVYSDVVGRWVPSIVEEGSPVVDFTIPGNVLPPIGNRNTEGAGTITTDGTRVRIYSPADADQAYLQYLHDEPAANFYMCGYASFSGGAGANPDGHQIQLSLDGGNKALRLDPYTAGANVWGINNNAGALLGARPRAPSSGVERWIEILAVYHATAPYIATFYDHEAWPSQLVVAWEASGYLDRYLFGNTGAGTCDLLLRDWTMMRF